MPSTTAAHPNRAANHSTLRSRWFVDAASLLIAIPAANRTAVTAIVTSRSVASEGCAVVATSTKVPTSPIATPA
jgi:hypothetical protein